MKKLLGIIGISLMLSSCEKMFLSCGIIDNSDQKSYEWEQKYLEKNMKYITHKIEYEGHSYLVFYLPTEGGRGICHDQNCECLTEK